MEDLTEAGGPPVPEIRYVTVRCGADRARIPVDRMKEVLTPQTFTDVPGSGPEVCGLIGLRGRVVTVFDLAVLLGGAALAPGSDHRVLIVEIGERTVGVAVAEVITLIDDTDFGAELVGEAAPSAPRVLDLDRLIGPKLA